MFSGDGTYNEVINGLRADIPVGFVPGRRHERAAACARAPARPGARRGARSPRARRGASRSAASTGASSRSTRASGSTPSSSGASTRSGRRADGKRPGDLAFALDGRAGRSSTTGSATRRRSRSRARPGGVRAVANCSPYTYAGRARPALRARRVLRGRPRHRRADRGSRRARSRASPPRRCADARAPATCSLGHDLDRIVIRCDAPLPAQVDGEDIGDIEEAEIVAVRDALTVLT